MTRSGAELLCWIVIAFCVGFLVMILLNGCEIDISTAPAKPAEALDAECKQAIRTYNLLDMVQHAHWRAHNLEAMHETYAEIVKLLEDNQRCFH